MNRSILIGFALGVLSIIAIAGITHKEPANRSVQEWTNMYPNDAARVWAGLDTTFASEDPCTLMVYPVTDGDSIFAPTRTVIAVIAPSDVSSTTEVGIIFYGKWCESRENLLVGEGETYGRYWDSLAVITDSARVRMRIDGHPTW